MTFFRHLRDRIIPLIILICVFAFVALILFALNLAIPTIMIILSLLLGAIIVGVALDYAKQKPFYESLSEVANSQEGASLYVMEQIDRPAFFEGELVYDTFERLSKDANDEIAFHKLSSQEYQEYIESWIHEIKTPIAASRLLLANANDSAPAALEFELDRIEAFIEQALYYARSTAVEKDYHIKSLQLHAVITSVVKKQSRTFIENDIRPVFENTSQIVRSDPKWLDFIIGQITANALKYYRPKTESHTPEIIYRVSNVEQGFDNEMALLTIEDNGIGIPSSDLSRVFEKGFTGGNGRLYAKSTGIGLYLCKKLCDQMKLSLSVESIEGTGSKVTIGFPLNKMYFLD